MTKMYHLTQLMLRAAQRRGEQPQGVKAGDRVGVLALNSEHVVEAMFAVVVPKAGATVSQEDIIAFCKSSLAGYKCLRSVEVRSVLPLSGAGKIRKYALRAVA